MLNFDEHDINAIMTTYGHSRETAISYLKNVTENDDEYEEPEHPDDTEWYSDHGSDEW